MDIDVRFIEGIKEPWQECNVCIFHTTCGRSWGLFGNTIPDMSPCFQDRLPPYYYSFTLEYKVIMKRRQIRLEENKKWMKQFFEKHGFKT